MNAVAIILGRAGSKGLPNKNMRDVAGRPCVQWTIDAARRASRVARVVVSTDDPAMLALARAQGLDAVARPPELATDHATIDAAARHALAAIDPDHRAPVAILYANVPVRPEGCIDRALERLLGSGADSVQSYQPVGKFHPWWTARVDPDSGRVAPWEGDVLNHAIFRRQDLPPAFIPDGAVIALTPRALRLEIPGAPPGPHAFFGVDRRGIVNPEGSVVDIDSAADLLVAHAALSMGRDR